MLVSALPGLLRGLRYSHTKPHQAAPGASWEVQYALHFPQENAHRRSQYVTSSEFGFANMMYTAIGLAIGCSFMKHVAFIPCYSHLGLLSGCAGAQQPSRALATASTRLLHATYWPPRPPELLGSTHAAQQRPETRTEGRHAPETKPNVRLPGSFGLRTS